MHQLYDVIYSQSIIQPQKEAYQSYPKRNNPGSTAKVFHENQLYYNFRIKWAAFKAKKKLKSVKWV